MDKRGEGEQFNWLFVILAGAIILSFFTVFTFKYIGLQEQKQTISLARTIQENIQLLQSSGIESYYIDDSSFKLGVVTNLEFSCDETKSSFIVNKNFVQDIQNEVVFAPIESKLSSLDAWIYSWNYPFFIVNLIFLSDPQRHYFFLYDLKSKEYVQNLEVPEIFTLQKQDKKNPIEAKSKKATFIYFTKPTEAELKKLSNQFEELFIISVDVDKQEIIFYEEGKEIGKEKYYGEAFLFAAIFSESKENYECGLARALTRLERTTEIYSTKALLLKQNAKEGCTYNTIQDALSKYPKKVLTDRKLPDLLSQQNQELGGKGCSTIF